MLYTVNLNEDRYILSVSHTDKDDTELNLDLIELKYLTCYRLINGETVLDEIKKAEMIAEEEREKKKPSDLEVLSAQVLYTAVMTDTLIEN